MSINVHRPSVEEGMGGTQRGTVAVYNEPVDLLSQSLCLQREISSGVGFHFLGPQVNYTMAGWVSVFPVRQRWLDRGHAQLVVVRS
jgi:hypothetical protein